MRVVADRLSLRWYLGYDLTEPLPDHSSLTRIRERYGLDVFRRFFEAIVEQCIAGGTGLGPGAVHRRHQGRGQRRRSTRSQPRFAVEAHLARALRRGGDADGDGATDGEPDGRRRRAGAVAGRPDRRSARRAGRARRAAATTGSARPVGPTGP